MPNDGFTVTLLMTGARFAWGVGVGVVGVGLLVPLLPPLLPHAVNERIRATKAIFRIRTSRGQFSTSAGMGSSTPLVVRADAVMWTLSHGAHPHVKGAERPQDFRPTAPNLRDKRWHT